MFREVAELSGWNLSCGPDPKSYGPGTYFSKSLTKRKRAKLRSDFSWRGDARGAARPNRRSQMRAWPGTRSSEPRRPQAGAVSGRSPLGIAAAGTYGCQRGGDPSWGRGQARETRCPRAGTGAGDMPSSERPSRICTTLLIVIVQPVSFVVLNASAGDLAHPLHLIGDGVATQPAISETHHIPWRSLRPTRIRK
jgi:hypothetical protein